jgi:hypothetical protein
MARGPRKRVFVAKEARTPLVPKKSRGKSPGRKPKERVELKPYLEGIVIGNEYRLEAYKAQVQWAEREAPPSAKAAAEAEKKLRDKKPRPKNLREKISEARRDKLKYLNKGRRLHTHPWKKLTAKERTALEARVAAKYGTNRATVRFWAKEAEVFEASDEPVEASESHKTLFMQPITFR